MLQPNDPDSYYNSRELVPADMLADIRQARIVITNYHAFMLRERMQLSKVGRELLQGPNGSLRTQETEGQMLQRVMPDLMNMKNILVMNDEGHHCYRRKPEEDEEGKLTGEDRQEAKKNNEAARVWINGLETIKRKVGISRVVDLSATPFFLRGSGYREGTSSPGPSVTSPSWTPSSAASSSCRACPSPTTSPTATRPSSVSSGSRSAPTCPRRGAAIRPVSTRSSCPWQLQTALEALYGHYEKTFDSWRDADIPVPPCFVIVCNNTSTSKLVYDYVSGFHRADPDGSTHLRAGQVAALPQLRRARQPASPYQEQC